MNNNLNKEHKNAERRPSDIGTIPEDWEVKKLGEVLDKIVGGGTPSRSNKEFWGNEIPWVTVKDFATFNPYFAQESITKKGLESSASHLIPSKTLITSTRMGLGKAVIYEVAVSINQDLKALYPSKCLFNKYLYYWFLKNSLLIEKLGSGSTVMGISLIELKNIDFLLPPLPEQKRIAAALSDMDSLLKHLEELIAKKRSLKQGAMQELLKPKQGWVVKEIGDDIDLLTGFPFPSNGYSKFGIRLLRCSNVKRGVTNWNDDIVQYWEKITPELKHYVLNEGDIVIAMDGSLVGRSFARLKKEDLPALLLQRVARIRSTKIDIGYLKEFICSEFFTKHCDSVKTSSAIPHISPSDIKCFKIPIPSSLPEQKSIAKILSEIDVEIEVLEGKRAKYQQMKTGMMQELLTGRVRLI